MKIATLTEEQKDNLYVTYDNKKFCLFCKENFGFTFIAAFKDKYDLEEAVQRYKLNPSLDHGVNIQFVKESND